MSEVSTAQDSNAVPAPMADHSVLLYSAEDVRELDRLSIEEHGIPGIRLMARAGRAAFDLIVERFPDIGNLLVFCGTGIALLAAARNTCRSSPPCAPT